MTGMTTQTFLMSVKQSIKATAKQLKLHISKQLKAGETET